MKEKVLRDLSTLYQQYGQLLLNKEATEVEIRIRQGLLNLLEAEELEQAKEVKDE